MKLHTVIADDLEQAIKEIKAKLGDEAIIVSSTKEGSKIKVLAALGEEETSDKTPKTKTKKRKDLETRLSEILKFHKLPAKISEEIIAATGTQTFDSVNEALEFGLFKSYTFSPIKFSENKPIMLFGLPGIGKTLAISKLMTEATFFNKKISVITTDIKRAGGIEQLSAFTQILGIELKIAMNPEELKIVLEDTKDHITIIDTSGANPYSPQEVTAVIELLKVADIEPVMVLPAGVDVEEAVDMARAYRAVFPKKLIVTKTDSARRFGSVITVARIMGLEFANLSSAPNVAKALDPITPKTLTNLIMRPFDGKEFQTKPNQQNKTAPAKKNAAPKAKKKTKASTGS